MMIYISQLVYSPEYVAAMITTKILLAMVCIFQLTCNPIILPLMIVLKLFVSDNLDSQLMSSPEIMF